MNMLCSACIGEVLTLPKNNGGFDIPSLQNIGEKLWLRKRYAIRHSDLDKVRQLCRDTAYKSINTDCLIQEEGQNHYLYASTTGDRSYKTFLWLRIPRCNGQSGYRGDYKENYHSLVKNRELINGLEL